MQIAEAASCSSDRKAAGVVLPQDATNTVVWLSSLQTQGLLALPPASYSIIQRTFPVVADMVEDALVR